MEFTKHDLHLLQLNGFIESRSFNHQWYKVHGAYFTFIWMNDDDWEVYISDFGNTRKGFVTKIYGNRYMTLEDLFKDISSNNKKQLWSEL